MGRHGLARRGDHACDIVVGHHSGAGAGRRVATEQHQRGGCPHRCQLDAGAFEPEAHPPCVGELCRQDAQRGRHASRLDPTSVAADCRGAQQSGVAAAVGTERDQFAALAPFGVDHLHFVAGGEGHHRGAAPGHPVALGARAEQHHRWHEHAGLLVGGCHLVAGAGSMAGARWWHEHESPMLGGCHGPSSEVAAGPGSLAARPSARKQFQRRRRPKGPDSPRPPPLSLSPLSPGADTFANMSQTSSATATAEAAAAINSPVPESDPLSRIARAVTATMRPATIQTGRQPTWTNPTVTRPATRTNWPSLEAVPCTALVRPSDVVVCQVKNIAAAAAAAHTCEIRLRVVTAST